MGSIPPLQRSARVSKATYITVLLLVFGLGMGFAKFKPFPYPQAVSLVKSAKKALARRSVDPTAEIARQYSKDTGPAKETRALDTALLPLNLTSFHVSAAQEFPKGAGGITMVGETLVMIDWLGGIYVFEGDRMVKRSFPALPNNIEAFVRSLHAPLAPGTLRVHDVQYVPEAKALAVSHERFDPERQLPQIAVSLIEIDPAKIAPVGEWRLLFKSEVLTIPRYVGQSGGGRLAAKDARTLLLSIGEYNQDAVMVESERVSQDPKSSFGKVVALDWKDGRVHRLSMGHRNPQGLLVTQSGEIYSTEHGPAGGDELNLVREGANFGWPNVTLGTDYGVYDWPLSKLSGSHAGYESPVFAWVPSVGISNLIEVRNFHPSWDGDLLVASLKGSSLFRLRMQGNRVIYSEPIWIGARIRDIIQTPSGAIALWTDDAKLMLIEVDRAKLRQNQRGMGFIGQTELATCMTCHHFDVTGPTHLAPTLGNIVGREIASDSFSRYSSGLKSKGGSWTPQKLREFIANPETFAPGSTMPKLPLSPSAIDAIVELLVNAGRKGGDNQAARH